MDPLAQPLFWLLYTLAGAATSARMLTVLRRQAARDPATACDTCRKRTLTPPRPGRRPGHPPSLPRRRGRPPPHRRPLVRLLAPPPMAPLHRPTLHLPYGKSHGTFA
ncbi:hypothetical protein SAMN05421505_11330 [Sinosporangium album]|uniref:Uncharacterized protein n=1 Tax=Sinosporangium album TaxID=504805 RepID=A0A1G8AWV8_9ACTN|nr:hypothetical protein [Sinosporangium album]SDH25421.1 hypothetical protein SAMN05421505_11330 [Sinosporangium album]